MAIQASAKDEEEGLIARERHPMRLPGMSAHLRHEALFVLGTSLESAIALKHLVHDSSARG